jgi:hypothetical protein
MANRDDYIGEGATLDIVIDRKPGCGLVFHQNVLLEVSAVQKIATDAREDYAGWNAAMTEPARRRRCQSNAKWSLLRSDFGRVSPQ